MSVPYLASIAVGAGLVALLGNGLVATPLFAATQQPPVTQSSATNTTVHKPVGTHKRTVKSTQPAPALAAAPATPPAPKPPDWPANAQAVAATVVWNSQGLSIDASNSSLSQILKDVSMATGVKVEGFGPDQRIFGTYGPGNARDVLTKLLDGSGYNVLLIGDKGQGTPREIVLSAQPKGAPPAMNNNPNASNDDSSEAEEQPQEQPQPQPPPPPAMRNGFAPGAPPRTPQQIMQEMQQRQQQMQQQQAPTNPQ